MTFIETMWNAWNDRRDRLRRAVSTYLEASHFDLFLDGRIAVAQTGIEMMASYLSRERAAKLMPVAWNDLRTAARVEALLVLLSIILIILNRVACKARPPNGTMVDMVADVRNAIIH